MTNPFRRKPHPARASRIFTAGLSLTAFLSMIASFSWNTHLADLAAASQPDVTDAATPAVIDSTAPAATSPAIPSANPSPSQSASGISPATPAKKTVKKSTKSTKTTTGGSTSTSGGTSGGGTTTTPTTAPTPATTVSYTCISDGSHSGKKSNFTVQHVSKSKCASYARWGYNWVQV